MKTVSLPKIHRGEALKRFLFDACSDTTLIISMVAVAASLALGIKTEKPKRRAPVSSHGGRSVATEKPQCSRSVSFSPDRVRVRGRSPAFNALASTFENANARNLSTPPPLVRKPYPKSGATDSPNVVVRSTAITSLTATFEQPPPREPLMPRSVKRYFTLGDMKGSKLAGSELHIEIGLILENEGISIGIVTAITAPASIRVDFGGNGGHAGATLMPQRNDAGLAAAEQALTVEKHVLESGSIDTVGILELHLGAINSIPRKAHMEICALIIIHHKNSKTKGIDSEQFQDHHSVELGWLDLTMIGTLGCLKSCLIIRIYIYAFWTRNEVLKVSQLN
uniref:Peptidase M20 dimerisation domain-containing protein n=1 Tax=Lactuca sativa TaxID=4236 RepID=A0A9R1V7T9_LACSA|nr:hypothetical protein LSAT_V11C600307170 [Lactuca sativa]